MNKTDLKEAAVAPEIRAMLAEGERHEAYAQVLFAYVDRLGDRCESDPLERVVSEMLDAYGRVAAGDAPLHRMRTYYTFHGLEPWPVPGTKLWVPASEDGGVDVEVAVQSTFMASNHRVHCVLELPEQDGAPQYVVRPVLDLKPAATEPTFFRLALRDAKFAREFGPRQP